MKISFHGAARTVTGTKHLLTLNNGIQVLLDCGMFQGMGSQTTELNNSFGFIPSEISFLLLSHAHIDHSGLIPKLVKEGFSGKIICTEPTFHLTEILLMDGAEIQTYEAAHNNKGNDTVALYNADDVRHALSLFEVIAYDKPLRLSPELTVNFSNTGHIVGSAAIHIAVEEDGKHTSIAFSGDVGRYRSALLQAPAKFPCADYLILESTYGNKTHDPVFNSVDPLLKWIKRTCIDKNGKLIIPAFSVGRTQEILYTLNQLELEKRLPELNYYVDSPLSKKATAVTKHYMEHFNDRLQEVLRTDDDPFDFNGLQYVESVEESRALARKDEPCVIISASGTADAGRVRHHLSSVLEGQKHTVLFVGFCSSQSTGGRLLNGDEAVCIFDEDQVVKCEIDALASMSAHGDADDLVNFISCQDMDAVKNIFLVHGEFKTQELFAERLLRKGYPKVTIPGMGEEFELE